MTLDEATSQLEQMQEDPAFITKGIYSPAADEFPNNHLPFVQVHLAYLRKHHQVDPAGYISNLRIMIKRR